MIKNYQIIIDDQPLELSKKVIEEISNGWQPFGGVCITTESSELQSTTYAQAMVKYANQET